METATRFVLIVGLAASLAGCAGTQAPIGTAVPTMQSREVTTGASGDLLYAASPSTIFVFTYPKPRRVSEITLPELGGGQVCSDASGNVFAPVGSATKEIVEYAHGGSQPIKILSSPAGSNPYACAVDSATGDLAVTNDNFAPHGSVEIYKGSSGSPQTYHLHGFTPYFCTYDNHSDLFVTGVGKYVLAVLRNGSSQFTRIALKFGLSDGIAWDGSYITVSRPHKDAIYRIKVEGNKGRIAGITQLTGAKDGTDLYQFWIQGNELIRPSGKYNTQVGLWHYPAGGAPIRLIVRFPRNGVASATVSVGNAVPSR
jgi:hypothetical protein